MSKKRRKLIKWFGKKFQLVIYQGNSYDVLRKFKYNRLGFTGIFFGLFVILFAVLSVIVVYTPVKQLIPGYPDRETRELIYENAIRTDSLITELEKREVYLKMLKEALFNEVPIDEDFVVPVENLTDQQIKDFNNPAKERQTIEDKTNYAFDRSEALPELFPPIQGMVVSSYNKAIGHYGTDIASSGESMIAATLRGTVLMSDYTVETGYTIIIQHKHDLVSVYKHNKASLVKEGQLVETGDAIAVYGGSGEDTNGEHLHFELWRNGVTINPEDYIIFE